jgi:hypothetical protein
MATALTAGWAVIGDVHLQDRADLDRAVASASVICSLV